MVSEKELKGWIDSLGKTFTPGSEESFAAFEEMYLTAYDAIFEELSKVATMDEGGMSDDTELSMSSWVDPTRKLTAVVSEGAFKPELLTAAGIALKQLDGRFAVMLSKYPTAVYVFPGDTILIRTGSIENDLVALGLK